MCCPRMCCPQGCVRGPDSTATETPPKLQRYSDHNSCLKRRLELWLKGDFEELLREGRTLQQRLRKAGNKANKVNSFIRSFTKLMLQGKTSAAIKLLLDRENSGILDLNNCSDPSDPSDM